jgi:hypothetical protein
MVMVEEEVVSPRGKSCDRTHQMGVFEAVVTLR